MKTGKKKNDKNCIWKKSLIILFWLVVWQILAWYIGNQILLEGPIGVLKYLFTELKSLEYYRTVLASVVRIMGGLVCGVLLAIFLGGLTYKNKWLKEMLLPIIQFLKSAPITCFVVLLLIWIGSENLTFFIALIVGFPPVYLNLSEGLTQLDENKLELARVYGMPFRNRFFYIYLPEIKSYFMSALTVSIGMAFKAGIAAEIIGTPDYSMGEQIYMSKIYLDTAGVLAWMITVILVAYLCEKIVVYIVGKCFDRKPKIRKYKADTGTLKEKSLELIKCTVGYDDKAVLQHISVEFKPEKVYAITGESGIGKTTLLKVLCGIKKTDEGIVRGKEMVKACVFQENRLFEDYTALENVFATGRCSKDIAKVEEALKELLPKEALDKPVKEYSGGMKRRVEIARAMLSESPVILMDEPFAGLDDKTKDSTIEFIEKNRKNRTILLTTHCLKDITKVKAEEYKL